MIEILLLIIGVFTGSAGIYIYILPKLKNLTILEIQNDDLGITVENALAEKERLSSKNLELLTENKFLTEKLIAVESSQKSQFEEIAKKIINENTSSIRNYNSELLQNLVNPVHEKIKDLRETIDKNAHERTNLRAELKQILDINNQLNHEAKELTRALKGDQKSQGKWGEVVLERILEDSGLEKGREYDIQYSTRDADDRIVRPDVVIYLPENRHIIIDAKVSLTSYEKAINCDHESERKSYLNAHLVSVKRHIETLSAKGYSQIKEINSPDFVLLFIPIESSYSFALREDESLFQYAWDRKIVIVSPTTLLATMRTINNVWRYEKINSNAQLIAQQSGALYDKFQGFLKDLEDMGKSIGAAQKHFDKAMNKISHGTGNLIDRTEKIKALGAHTKK